MQVKIYGRKEGCKYCDRAKMICTMNSYEMEFVDIDAEQMSPADLAEICGVPVRSVPQIFVDGEYVGGCDKFEEYLKAL